MTWLARLFGRMPFVADSPERRFGTGFDRTVEMRLARLAQGARTPCLPGIGVFRRSR